jgi:hypothetical protein
MIGRVIKAKAVTAMTTRTVIGMITVKATEKMITDTILDIGQSPAMIIIGMSISTNTNITAIGIRGIRGNTIEVETLII